MKIIDIKLYNFGSYEGSAKFDFSSCTDQRRIVVFGGKNGAGKTTLFTAIQVGLYGNYAFGFRTPGKLYKKEIVSLINNNAKLDESKSAYVQITFSERQNLDVKEYVVKRSWTWLKKEVEETLEVSADGIYLDDEAIIDFQNYLIHLIPPELMNLYFFDGESVVDAFLGENKGNIHDALMTLSGNDTFEILYSSLRKLLRSKSSEISAAEEYSSQKEQVQSISQKIADLKEQSALLEGETDEVRAELDHLSTNYESKGGVTTERWKELQQQLRDEELKREQLNIQRKQAAESVLPFMIVLPLLEKVKDQIKKESSFSSYVALQNVLHGDGFLNELMTAASSIGSLHPEEDGHKLFQHVSDYLLKDDWTGFSPVLSLSEDDAATCMAFISRAEETDEGLFTSLKEQLDQSIERSKKIRSIIESSSVDTLESYLNERFRLQEEIEKKIADSHQLHAELERLTNEFQRESSLLESRKKEFIQAVKSKSVDALAGKVMLIVESLQDVLYERLIGAVEQDLNLKLKELMRKDDFWQEVHIDEKFNVHIICQQPADIAALISTYEASGLSGLKMKIGEKAYAVLLEQFHTTDRNLPERLKETVQQSVILPMELEFDRLSKGEKQVFVMSLYWAIMNQSNNEIPFIIDTPFARIDAEHRDNIAQHFFTQLKGQLFVMSTDEELNQHHLSSMENQIAELYMLEYDESLKRTMVRKNSYFEV